MAFWDFLCGTTEKPSPSNIVKDEAISLVDHKICINLSTPALNIPFTKDPRILPIMMIPDSNSMDGLMDFGHNPLYIEPADPENKALMLAWLEREFLDSGGMNANDVVYRIPADWSQPAKFYAIHRVYKVGRDKLGRWWKFKGINNPRPDPYIARDENIMWLNTGVIF